MTKLVELDLEFDFADAIEAVQFDDDSTHGNSSMRRVDFIAEYEDCYRFIEVKDPDINIDGDHSVFLRKFQSGQLVTSLAGKYRDSLLFRVLSNKCDKDMHYVVLLSMASIEPPMLLNKLDALRHEIPLNHNDWVIPSAKSCVILNLEQYKKQFGENSVRRISDGVA